MENTSAIGYPGYSNSHGDRFQKEACGYCYFAIGKDRLKMRHYIRVFGIVAGLMFFLFNSDILAEDMRSMSQSADQKKQELIRKAQQEKAESLKEQEESRQKIKSDEDLLVSAIAKLKSENNEIEKQLREIETQLIEKAEQEKILIEKLSEASSEMRELGGFVRVSASDLEGN